MRAPPKDWRDFAAWCDQRGLRALPAHPWTLAAYLRWCEAHHRLPTVHRRLAAIARHHVLRCAPRPDRNPIVARTLQMIEQRARLKADRAGLFQPDDFTAQDSTAVTPRPAPPRKARKARGLRQRPRLVSRRP